MSLALPDAAATDALGARLAEAVAGEPGVALVVHLAGDLGAGKTALVRALLRGLGHRGRVPSPTYTLVEPYRCDGRAVHHADLYRLADPADAEVLGLGELPEPGGLLLVEWPDRATGRVPPADLAIRLEVAGRGRRARIAAASPAGEAVLARLRRSIPSAGL